MKNKKWLILLIVAFPSVFWLILESSTINSSKLPHYGPKTAVDSHDTIYYTVPDKFIVPGDSTATNLDLKQFPLFALVFVSEKYRGDSYRLAGLWEYLNYKKDKIEHIPVVIVTPSENGKSLVQQELQKLGNSSNVHFRTWPSDQFDSFTRIYFKEKPYYIDYSYFLLIDAERSIRGYYDARYVAEMKRLIDEYQHLRIKEEKKQMIKENEVKRNS